MGEGASHQLRGDRLQAAGLGLRPSFSKRPGVPGIKLQGPLRDGGSVQFSQWTAPLDLLSLRAPHALPLDA